MRKRGVSDRERQIARELRHDLRYVQANYEITPRQLVIYRRYAAAEICLHAVKF